MIRLSLLPLLVLAPLLVLPACSGDLPTSPSASPTPPPPPPAGSLQITTRTTGADIDSDGYTCMLDGSSFEAMGVNETGTVTGLSVGSHMVLLSGIAANCELNGPNPRWVTVTAGETVQTTFSIACTGYRG